MNYKQIAIALFFVALSDYLLYQVTGGYAAWGFWISISAALIYLGTRETKFKGSAILWILTAGTVLTSLRLIWEGNVAVALAGISLLVCWCAFLHKVPLRFGELVVFTLAWLPSGLIAMPVAIESLARSVESTRWKRVAEYAIPVGIAGLFALIFVNANPESLTNLWTLVSTMWGAFTSSIPSIALSQVLLWLLLILIALGALKPESLLDNYTPPPEFLAQDFTPTELRSSSFTAGVAHKTLAALVILFTIYLALEIHAMWFTHFPEGFHYSGYAHRGAAWLTLALAIATGLLSFLHGYLRIPEDRAASIHRLSMIWLLQNGLLVLCVYNRLWIYVQFNGLTKLRVVGFIGVTCVAIGLLLVMSMTRKRWSIENLLRRQTLTFFVAVFLYVVIPVDWLVHRYNCSRILSGDEAPSVQLHVQSISSTGWLELIPLTESPTPHVREGTKALLMDVLDRLEAKMKSGPERWHRFQVADFILVSRLQTMRKSSLQKYDQKPGLRELTIDAFRVEAMHWY